MVGLLAALLLLLCAMAPGGDSLAVSQRQSSCRRPSGASSQSRRSLDTTKSVTQLDHDTKLVRAIEELALDISSTQWEKGHAGNVVQSPISLASLLNLLLLASRGDSYVELKRALHYPNDMPDTAIHESFRKILTTIGQKSSGVDVSESSRLFLQEGFPVLGQFTSMAEELYGSKVVGLDFAGSPSKAMTTINKWVERSTFGKITDLITSPFSADTKMVASNVVYFNGEWENPFNKDFTSDGIFNTGRTNITIPIMKNLLTVPYLGGDDYGFDMIALPYKGGKYSMYIMTPRGQPGIRSLQRLEYSLDSKVLKPLIECMVPKRVSLRLPKMKLSQKIYLKNDLKTLGVQSIFDPKKADFGRLSTQTGIYVNDIVHEAILEITEAGTVAAAATAVTFDRIGGNEFFNLDRPSLIFIRDEVNGLMLFWARVMEPEAIPN